MSSFSKNLISKVGYYALVFLPIVAYLTLLGIFSTGLSSLGDVGASAVQIFILVIVLGTLVVHYAVSMLGMVWFGDPKTQNRTNLSSYHSIGWDNSKKLVFCFVSQGIQEESLKRSVAYLLEVARSLQVRFSVEIVVDTAVPKDPFFAQRDIELIRVPDEYVTTNGSRFKARSLQYAAEYRDSQGTDLADTWIVHCDEDTCITESCIAGIWKFLREPKNANSCGAGEIKFNSGSYGLGNFFSLLASLLTGEDLGRYRLQYGHFRASIFGAHGSFFVVPAKLERTIQFDFGPRGSMGEDLYFTFKARELGISFGWIEGYVREQPTYSLGDFFRQRARWVRGALNFIFDGRFSIGNRLVLLAYYGVWRLTVLLGIAAFFIVASTGNYALAFALWGLDVAVMSTILMVGALRNMQEDMNCSTLEKAGTLAAVFFLTPIVCLLETAASATGLVVSEDNFHVVRKSAKA